MAMSGAMQVRKVGRRDGAKAHAQEMPPGYKQTELGLIPEDWEVVEIGDLRPFVTSGSRGWARFYAESGASFLRIGNLSRDSIYLNFDDLKRVWLPRDTAEAARTEIQDGDLLISITADIGIVGWIGTKVEKPGYINQHIALIRVSQADASSKFIAYYLASERSQRDFAASTDVGAKTGMNLTTIRKIGLALPPPVEQRAIAEALSDVDGLLEALEALIAKKRAIKQASMQQLLTGKTRLPGFSGEWETKRLGDVVDRLVGGGTPSRSNAAFWGDDIPWVTVKDFATFNPQHTQESITRLGLNNSASHLIPAGTLITSTRMALGKAVVFDVDVAINQDLKAVFLRPSASVRFLFYWFECNARMIDDLGSGSTVKGISIAQLGALPFPSLSLAEQTAIATVLSDMNAEIAALEARRDKTRAIKQGMMQQLLTGRVRLVKPEAAA